MVPTVITVPIRAAMIVTTPTPIVIVIIMTMAWTDVDATRSNLYADM
jgi:hypothetical protein